jgi:hypothetical protein
MAFLLYAANETNRHNTDGVCSALYFDAGTVVTRELVEEALNFVRANRQSFQDLPLPVTVDDDLDFEVWSTPLSEQAGWVRVVCNGGC